MYKRRFSVFEVTSDGLQEVYDSKDDFERITAGYIPGYFNCSNDDNEIDSRSGKKGPEPENVTIGKAGGRTYAFIAIERIGGIMVYDITEPSKTTFVNYINSREFENAIQGDVSPEGLCFVESQSGNPLLLTACEVSGTLPVYELKARSTQSSGEETKPTTPTTSNTTSTTTSSVTVETVKDAEGKTISAKAEAEVSGKSSKSGVKGSLLGSVIAQITEAAGTKSVTVEVTVSAGDQSYMI